MCSMDEPASPEGGLPAKYQKLAYEYSKLRAQAQVLKKAVSEEQARSTELKETLKDKEQGIRKLEQEVESLHFCNQQLTKRVGFLQEELENDRTRRNKKKYLATPSPVHQGVIDAELQSRIEENEKLHLEVSSAKLEHEQMVQRLQEELEEARHAVVAREGQLGETVHRQEDQISRLTQDRARLELKLKASEKELKDVLLRSETSESELREVKLSLGTRLKEVTEILDETLLFRDTGDRRLSRQLDVPVPTYSQEAKVRAVLCQLASSIPEAIQALSTLHTYTEQRVRLLLASAQHQGPLLMFAQHLHTNVSYLQPIEEAYQSYFEAVCTGGLYLLDGGPSVVPISMALSKYVCYLQKLLPYIMLSLKAGPVGPSCKCEELVSKLGQTASRVVCKFTKMDRYLQLLSGNGCQDGSGSCHCAGYAAIVGKLVTVARGLSEDFDDAKRQLSSLMLEEQELPTRTAEAQRTDDCLVSSLVAVANSCRKVFKALESQCISEQTYQRRGVRRRCSLCTSHLGPLVATWRQRGASYLTKCQLAKAPDSIPYDVSVENLRAMRSHIENRESSAQQLDSCKAKIRKLEEEKEHWMLEWQLMQAKFERQTKDLVQNPSQPLESGEGDGQVIAAHFKARIREMIRLNQLADSKAVFFHAECKALQHRLHLGEMSKAELTTQLQETQLALQQLRDEMSSMAKSYEDQLSTMSEHLASMNEKLTQQKDEIDALRHSSNSKFGKKAK